MRQKLLQHNLRSFEFILSARKVLQGVLENPRRCKQLQMMKLQKCNIIPFVFQCKFYAVRTSAFQLCLNWWYKILKHYFSTLYNRDLRFPFQNTFASKLYFLFKYFVSTDCTDCNNKKSRHPPVRGGGFSPETFKQIFLF